MKEEKTKNYFLKDKIINNILSREDFRDYTSSIISKVLGLPYEEVFENLRLDSYRVNENANYKDSIVDNMYNLDSGVVNIEINYCFDEEHTNKNMRYLCHLLLKQVGPGDKDIYKKVQQININAYDYFKKGEFLYKSTLREEKYNLYRSDLMEIYDINMEYLRKLDYNLVKKMNSSQLEKLLYIFICEEDKKRKKLYRGDVLMEKVNDELYKLTDDGVLYYNLEEFHNRVAKSIGRKEGRIEKERETVLKIYSKGKTISEICDLLDLSLENVEKIICENE